ncbi:helix-turn-helix domain-containing protein [Nocardioides sp. dk4132]|uniref:helix-turn-helix domain-containing protein n=1 Tax=unclassified Nocardioides TaxID=2615069 RepID=UPI0012978D52|nr:MULTISPECIES: helix-turn-helix transcriptional regulator [unclassified Nocardioides]MQW74831.1 helix-turn-helix domain-containing protein [Nocardioides sp. dk4132]QGA06719.1 helix-turn-helix domain-containing protein [Nocardioides sp. dk884]
MSATRAKFNEFRAKRLQNPAVRAAYEDARARNGILDALVRRRRALGLSQGVVARAMDVGQSTVSGFETEGSDPRLSTLQRYARAVDASLYVHVVPNMPAGQRPAVYVSYPGGQNIVANPTAATSRVAAWVDSKPAYVGRNVRPYLNLVPQSA